MTTSSHTDLLTSCLGRRMYLKASAAAIVAPLALSLAGCSNARGSSTSNNAGTTSATSSSESGTQPEEAGTNASATDSKTIVIYYSRADMNYASGGPVHTSVGNTEVMAGYITAALGCASFKVAPEQAYPYEYDECCDQAKSELNANARPAVGNMSQAPDLAQYSTILLGSPVWWGHMPCTLRTYLESQDFTGKTVIPFTTHAGSGLGQVVSDAQESCKGATIDSSRAMSQLGESISGAGDEVASWSKGLGLA